MDSFDVPLLDDDLQAEIQMVTALIEAANLSDGPLSSQFIDTVLGFGLAGSGAVGATAGEEIAAHVDRSPRRAGRRRQQPMAMPV